MLQLSDNQYTTYTRWGRVGERGQSKDYPADLKSCIDLFKAKFKEKTGNTWEQRASASAKPGKYTLIDILYDDVEQQEDEAVDAEYSSQVVNTGENVAALKKTTLLAETQRLLELIFNETYFQAVLNDIGYDSSKIPLGRLGKTTLSRGYQLLKNLAEQIGSESPDKEVSICSVILTTLILTCMPFSDA